MHRRPPGGYGQATDGRRSRSSSRCRSTAAYPALTGGVSALGWTARSSSMASTSPAPTTPAAGGHVPRAKRTNRAEARRRYRASSASPSRRRLSTRRSRRRRLVRLRRRPRADDAGASQPGLCLSIGVPAAQPAGGPARAAEPDRRSVGVAALPADPRRGYRVRVHGRRQLAHRAHRDVLRRAAGPRVRVPRRLPRAAGELPRRPDHRVRVRSRRQRGDPDLVRLAGDRPAHRRDADPDAGVERGGLRGRFSVPCGGFDRPGGLGFAGRVDLPGLAGSLRFGGRVTDAVGVPVAVSLLAAGPGLLRVPDVADLRHVLRRVGRLVPALPAPVEPEPRAPAAAAARSGRPVRSNPNQRR